MRCDMNIDLLEQHSYSVELYHEYNLEDAFYQVGNRVYRSDFTYTNDSIKLDSIKGALELRDDKTYQIS